MSIFITIKNSCFYLCVSLICICYQESRCPKISTFSYIYFSFFWCVVSFLLIRDFVCIYVQANLWCYNCHVLLFLQYVSLQVHKLPHHPHAGGTAFFLLDIDPLGFVSTFIVHFSTGTLNKSFDNASPCPSPTTISKQSDIIPWIFHLDFSLFHYHLNNLTNLVFKFLSQILSLDFSYTIML